MYVCVLSRFSHVQLFATLWTVALQAPLYMGFSRQEYWRGVPYPLPGDLPDPGIEPVFLMAPALAARFFTTSASVKFSVPFFSMIPLLLWFSSVKSGLTKAGSDFQIISYQSSFILPFKQLRYYICFFHENLCSLGFLDTKNYHGLPFRLLTPYFFLFLISGQLPYNIVLVSAMYQYESAIGIRNPLCLNLLPTFHRIPPHRALV